MKLLKERLKLAMAGPPKISQASLARACKVSGPSVNGWLSGKTQTLEAANLLAAARHLAVNPDWLATGKGPMKLNDSHPTTVANTYGLREPASHSLTLDEQILCQSLVLLEHDEGGGKRPYSLIDRAARIAGLYALLVADGGRLTKEHNREFERQVRARQQGVESGDQLADKRAAARRGK